MFHIARKHHYLISREFAEHLLIDAVQADIISYTIISNISYADILTELLNSHIPESDIYIKISTKLITDEMLQNNSWIVDSGEHVGNNFTPVYYVPICYYETNSRRNSKNSGPHQDQHLFNRLLGI